MAKILYVATTDSHIANFHMPFIEMLTREDHVVEVAAKASNRVVEIEKCGVLFHNVEFPRDINVIMLIKAYIQLRQLCETKQYDLIHVHTPISSAIARLAVLWSHIKILYTSHGFYFYNGAPKFKGGFYYLVERILSYRTNCILTMNDEDYSAALNFKHCSVKKVDGVGLDLDKYKVTLSNKGRNDLLEALGLNKDSKILLSIAELTERKNHFQLINIVEILVKKIPETRLLIVGEGHLLQELESIVIKKKLKRHIIFLGFRRDIPELLAISNVLVNVAKSEGLPRCVMEAMAASKPVIVSEVRGHIDLIDHGSGGFLFNLNEADIESSTLFEKLLNDVSLQNDMGIYNLSKIQKYSINNVLLQMKEIYKEII